MKLSRQVKSISYLKAHAREVVRSLAETREPVALTVHGEAKAVLQDVAHNEEMPEMFALLKVLALTNEQVETGKVHEASEVFRRIRQHVSRS